MQIRYKDISENWGRKGTSVYNFIKEKLNPDCYAHSGTLEQVEAAVRNNKVAIAKLCEILANNKVINLEDICRIVGCSYLYPDNIRLAEEEDEENANSQ